MSLFLPLLIQISSGLSGVHANASPVQVGQVFTLQGRNLSGEAFDLKKSHGKRGFIHLFATWCPGCKTELPVLKDFYEKHRGEMWLICVTPEKRRHRSEVRRFMEAYPFETALMEDVKGEEIPGGVSLPTTFVLDSKGVLRRILSPAEGALSRAILEKAFLAAGE